MNNQNIPSFESEDVLGIGGREAVLSELAGFGYDYDPPVTDARILLTKDIYRTQNARESLLFQQFSQTPLLPSRLYELGNQPYAKAVTLTLEQRLADTVEYTGLPDEYADAILKEIHVEADIRFKGNDNAGKRLLDFFETKESSELSQGEAQLFWRNRTGDANLSDTGDLLLRYPVIGSVEAMKHTAPLKLNEVGNSEMFINHHLDEFRSNVSAPSRLHMEEFEKDDPRRHRRPLRRTNITHESDVTPELIYGEKENLAEVTDGTTTIVLVKKQTYILLPPALHLNHVVPNIRRAKHPLTDECIEINVQPIATTAYWRLKK